MKAFEEEKIVRQLEREEKMKIVLFSIDEYFIKVFIEFIAKKRTDIEMIGFTSEAAARQYLLENKVSVLFCEEGYFEEWIGKLAYIILGFTSIMPKEDVVGRLNIYQKSSLLLEDFDRVINVCMGRTVQNPKMSGEQIVVYSTEGGAGKTTVAYLMAVQAAKRNRTVYWNLELLPATDNLYRQEFQNTMEELMFQRQSTGDIKSLLYDVLKLNVDGVYVLPTVKSYGNYKDIDEKLIQELCMQMYGIGMEKIILDLPGGRNPLVDALLSTCSHIVWVFSDSVRGRKKEENVKQDPSLRRLLAKSSFVRNFCAERTSAAGVTAAFPRSGTLGTAAMISAVLEVNQDFANGCKAILQAAESTT